LAAFDETSLIKGDQVWQYHSESRSEHSGEDLDVTVAESDRTPVGKRCQVTIRLRDQGDQCLRPRRGRRSTLKNRIKKGKKNGNKGISEGLIPLIRQAIWTWSASQRESTDSGGQLFSCKGGSKKGKMGAGKAGKIKGR
jgi:hypothetical protein